VFVFVTDGITEAHSKNGELFGDERRERVVLEFNASNATAIRDSVLPEVKEFAGEEFQHDNQTIVVVKAP
jgi:serine phosphatase RsbU (regulator of sigma subunit)